MGSFRAHRAAAGLAAACLVALAAAGCESLPGFERLFARPEEEPPPAAIPVEIYRRADQERAERLEAEVVRLRADLQRAEEVLVAIESGLSGTHSRAEAVSSLAEARIRVERAATAAPWRADEIAEARSKLASADGHIREGNLGAAIFFVYRATRISDDLEQEAEQVARIAGARRVRGRRVNLRSGPSTDDAVLAVLTRGTPVVAEGSDRDWTLVRTTGGRVGWVHSGLLESR